MIPAEWTLKKEGREYSLTFKKMYVVIKFFLAGFYISHPRKSMCRIFNMTWFSKKRDPETFPPGPKSLVLD